MPVKRLLISLFLVIVCSCVVGQRIDFFKEDLVFSIDSACFSVNGDYYFRNPSNSPLTVKVLFPVSRTAGYKTVDTIIVYDISKPANPVKTEVKDSIASFMISFLPFSEKCVKIYYKQHHDGSRAKYILLSTKMWQKPLNEASYTLITGRNLIVSGLSITPDKIEDFSESKVYYWKRKHFMPDRDFVFEFTVKE